MVVGLKDMLAIYLPLILAKVRGHLVMFEKSAGFLLADIQWIQMYMSHSGDFLLELI
jgi:hypothetical protein